MEKSPAPAAAAQPMVRWVTSRKAALIAAIRDGEITLEEACRQYQLSPGEFADWLAAFEKHGVPGLRATRFQIYRDKPRSSSGRGHQPGASAASVGGTHVCEDHPVLAEHYREQGARLRIMAVVLPGAELKFNLRTAARMYEGFVDKLDTPGRVGGARASLRALSPK